MSRSEHGGARLLAGNAHLLKGTVLAFDPPESTLTDAAVWSSRSDTLPPRDGTYGSAVVFLPKGRRRQRLLFAFAAACASRLVVVGDKRTGIKSAKKELRAGNAIVGSAHGHHHQLFALDWADGANAGPVLLADWTQPFDVEGRTFTSLPGVFADGRLDDASALLLDALGDSLAGADVLDVGCGAGVLGLTLRARGAERVVLTDVDAFALASARMNAGDDPAVEVRFSDVFAELGDARFDAIVSNPPFHQGVATEYQTARRLLSDAPSHLRPGGQLVIVANRFLPWRSELEAVFDAVSTLAETPRFVVLRARR